MRKSKKRLPPSTEHLRGPEKRSSDVAGVQVPVPLIHASGSRSGRHMQAQSTTGPGSVSTSYGGRMATGRCMAGSVRVPEGQHLRTATAYSICVLNDQ